MGTIKPCPPYQTTGATATAGDSSVSVAFTAPANDGGAAITEYRVSCDTPNHFDSAYAFSQTGAASPITVTGLTNGTVYKCVVNAKNSAGYGIYSSASNSFTPVAAASAPSYDPGPFTNTLSRRRHRHAHRRPIGDRDGERQGRHHHQPAAAQHRGHGNQPRQ